MDYIVDDKLSAPVFLALAKNVWQGITTQQRRRRRCTGL